MTVRRSDAETQDRQHRDRWEPFGALLPFLAVIAVICAIAARLP